MKYQNIHTKEILEIVSTEKVGSLTVHIFNDGSRWNDELLSLHWRLVEQSSSEASPTGVPSQQDAEGACS